MGMLHVRRQLALLLAHTEMRWCWTLLLRETAVHTIASPDTRAAQSHQMVMRRETRIHVWVTEISQRKLLQSCVVYVVRRPATLGSIEIEVPNVEVVEGNLLLLLREETVSLKSVVMMSRRMALETKKLVGIVRGSASQVSEPWW